MTKHIVLSWEDFDLWIDELVKTIRFSQQARAHSLKFVYGPPRGGLIPAVALSHRLGLNLIVSLPELTEELERQELNFGSILWVDEIVETGSTLQLFLNTSWASLPRRTGVPILACWVSKLPSTRFPALHSGISLDKDTWVVFPWEDPTTWKRELEEYNARRQ